MNKKIIYLTLITVLSIFLINYGKNEYLVLETEKENYKVSVTINESSSDTLIKNIIENATTGDTISVDGTVEINNYVELAGGATLVIKENSNLIINKSLTNKGTINISENGTLTLNDNLKLYTNSYLTNYGTVMVEEGNIITTYSNATEDNYATIELRNCDILSNTEDIYNKLSSVTKIKLENYCLSISPSITSIFNSENIINNHAVSIVDEDTSSIYTSLNSIPENTSVLVNGPLILNSDETIKSTVNVTVVNESNSLIYVTGSLTIEGNLTMNDNSLIANSLLGNGNLHIIASQNPTSPNTTIGNISNTLNVYLDNENISFGYNIFTINYNDSNYDKNPSTYQSYLDNFNLKTN